jgi:hypothetical protein
VAIGLVDPGVTGGSGNPDFSKRIQKIRFIMKIALFALFFQLTLAFHLLASQISVSGNVSGVWDLDTFFVNDNIVIPNGSTLSILPASLILFQGHFFLKVDGRLLAQGIQSVVTYFLQVTIGEFVTGHNLLRVD